MGSATDGRARRAGTHWASVIAVTYDDIEWTLLRSRQARGTIMPRFTPLHWWECDLIEITPAGYFREFEIKMSRKDYFIDAQKQRAVDWNSPLRVQGRPVPIENKHTLLAAGDPRGPSCFWFVTPAGLIQEHELPLWAGLIEVHFTLSECGESIGFPQERIVKEAPRLHRVKVDPKITQSAKHSAYGRLHHEWHWAYYRKLCARAHAGNLTDGAGI